MSDLTDFLLARIAEDEAAARASLIEAAYFQFGNTAAEALLGLAESEGAQPEALDHFARHDPARVLAECAAKRAILLIHSVDCLVGAGENGDDEFICSAGDASSTGPHPGDVSCPTLNALAVVYADHPDYRKEWRV